MTDDTTRTQTHLTWRELERKEPGSPQANADKKVLAGICAIFLGALGVHKFVLGNTLAGWIMLLTTLLTLGYGAFLTVPVGVIEGVLYLTKSNDEFVRLYVAGRRAWF